MDHASDVSLQRLKLVNETHPSISAKNKMVSHCSMDGGAMLGDR